MRIEDQKPNLRRRVAIAGGAALLTTAGLGGYAALSAPTMHLVKAPVVSSSADTDTQNVQEGDQGAPDTVPAAPEAAGPKAPAAAEAPGAPDQTGASDGPGGPDTQQDGNFDGNF